MHYSTQRLAAITNRDLLWGVADLANVRVTPLIKNLHIEFLSIYFKKLTLLLEWKQDRFLEELNRTEIYHEILKC